MAWVLILCKQIGTLEKPGYSSPYVAMGTTAASNWGLSTGSMRTCTFMVCPLKPAFPFTVMVWNGGIVTFCVVQTAPLTPSNWYFFTSTGSLSPDKSCSANFSELLWDSYSDPDITAPKRACHQVAVALASSPTVMQLRALSIIFEPTTTGTFWHRLWWGWPTVAHPHCSLLSPEFGG